ncbi:MAG: hypothetical protein KJN64_02475 [Ignavibacteria bacterium]|nr:hypothetical protein [Ignavibacteria bacterium]NNL22780.1 hypothetical protein [Ignavibacteriaceae bacterium]
MNLNTLKYPLVVSISLFGYCNIFPQEPATAQFDDYYENTDTLHKILPANSEELPIELRVPPEDLLQEFRNDSAFDYENKLEQNEDWITRIKNWINQQLQSLRYSETYYTALDIFYYALIIFALIIIIWGLFRGDKGFLFFRKSINNEIEITEQKEDLNQINFDDLIDTAIENKNYKLAVRYLFLKSLKLLSDKEIIYLKKDKTNSQYLAEIKNIRLADAFKDAVYRFEWIWYGDFPIDEAVMSISKNDFNKLFKLIKS